MSTILYKLNASSISNNAVLQYKASSSNKAGVSSFEKPTARDYRRVAQIVRPASKRLTHVSKLSSQVRTLKDRRDKLIASYAKYGKCVDFRDYRICVISDHAAGKMFRGGKQ